MVPKSFSKEVADIFRDIKGDFERSLEPPQPDGCDEGGSRHKLDKSVVEQIRADLDGIIKKHDPTHDPVKPTAPDSAMTIMRLRVMIPVN